MHSHEKQIQRHVNSQSTSGSQAAVCSLVGEHLYSFGASPFKSAPRIPLKLTMKNTWVSWSFSSLVPGNEASLLGTRPKTEGALHRYRTGMRQDQLGHVRGLSLKCLLDLCRSWADFKFGSLNMQGEDEVWTA